MLFYHEGSIMNENLEWEKRKSMQSNLAKNLDTLMHGVVLTELKNINGKIESLCSMGILKDNEKLSELREKMKQLQAGTKNDSSK